MTPKKQSPRSLQQNLASSPTQDSPLANSDDQQPRNKRIKYSNVQDNESGPAITPKKSSLDTNVQYSSSSQRSYKALAEAEDDNSNQNHEPVTPSPSRKQAHALHGGYNALKSFNGQVYSGMAVGGSHTWNYDPGVWKETKEEPDLWKIDYQTTKRRAKNAPSGSGAPVGTEYHWLIVAHQYVKKVDANTYETHLAGSKYKLAHKNSSSNSWSIPTVKMQRDQEIELLEDAKRRVQGLPPVLSTEKVRVEKTEKGQQKLESLFSKAAAASNDDKENQSKRKRSVELE